MKKYFLFSSILFLCFYANAQPGCTDPQADNYDATATDNDGSCQYPETTYVLDLIAELPESLIENSGLVHLPQGLYTHNDAGNPNEIYRIDSSDGSVLQTLLVIAENEDWEDMAESETHIFIGDFGNNKGNRTDLRIYKIDKAELGNNVLNAQPINFSFADQTDFSENQNSHDYDCEAFFFHDDSLHLFTKNWVDNQTRHYAIPAEPGFHSASPKYTFDVDGLITSADINEEGTIALLGYTADGFNFMWLFFHYKDNHFLSGHKRKISLGTGLTNSQTEAITFIDKNGGYISSEQFDLGQIELPPKLLSFNIDQWIPTFVSSTNSMEEIVTLKTFPNPFEDDLSIELPEDWNPSEEITVSIFDVNGRFLLTENKTVVNQKFNLDNLDFLTSGNYIIKLQSDDKSWEGRLLKK